jgi:metal-sulfur cluster biosynthetic enzyme
MKQVQKEQIIEILKQCYDPELPVGSMEPRINI